MKIWHVYIDVKEIAAVYAAAKKILFSFAMEDFSLTAKIYFLRVNKKWI